MTDDMLAMQERLAERQELERLRAEVRLWRWRAIDAWGEINSLRQRDPSPYSPNNGMPLHLNGLWWRA